MGLTKERRKVSFADGFTAAGSAGFSGPVLVNTGITLSGPVSAPTGSSSTQRFGVLRINSGATSATASTTAINSGGMVFITPILLGAGVASYNLIGQVVVTTVAQAASGGYWSVGYTGTQNGVAANIDVYWHIVNPA